MSPWAVPGDEEPAVRERRAQAGAEPAVGQREGPREPVVERQVVLGPVAHRHRGIGAGQRLGHGGGEAVVAPVRVLDVAGVPVLAGIVLHLGGGGHVVGAIPLSVRQVVDDVGGAVGTERQALAPVGEHAEVVVVGVVLHHQDDDVPDLRQQVGALGQVRARPVAGLRRDDPAPRRGPRRRRAAASDLAALQPLPHSLVPPATVVPPRARCRAAISATCSAFLQAVPQTGQPGPMVPDPGVRDPGQVRRAAASRSGPRPPRGSCHAGRTSRTGPKPCRRNMAAMSSGASSDSQGSPRSAEACRPAPRSSRPPRRAARSAACSRRRSRCRRETARDREGLLDGAALQVHRDAQPADEGGPGEVEPSLAEPVAQRVPGEIHRHERDAVRVVGAGRTRRFHSCVAGWSTSKTRTRAARGDRLAKESRPAPSSDVLADAAPDGVGQAVLGVATAAGGLRPGAARIGCVPCARWKSMSSSARSPSMVSASVSAKMTGAASTIRWAARAAAAVNAVKLGCPSALTPARLPTSVFT